MVSRIDITGIVTITILERGGGGGLNATYEEIQWVVKNIKKLVQIEIHLRLCLSCRHGGCNDHQSINRIQNISRKT